MNIIRFLQYKIILCCTVLFIWNTTLLGKENNKYLSNNNFFDKTKDLFNKTTTYREPKIEWWHLLEGFRKAHNLNLNIFYAQGQWNINHFSSIQNMKYTFHSSNYKFYYSYHIPIIKRFGYFLGTSVGFSLLHSELKDLNNPNIYMLPGFIGGFIININSLHRIYSGIDLYLERWENFKDQDDIEDSSSIHITARSYNWFAGIDIFYAFKEAIRIEFQKKQSLFSFAKERIKDIKTQAKIYKNETWIGIGIVYHLL